MDAEPSTERRSKRTRRPTELTADAGSADLRAGASTTGRPTPAEEHEALGVIRAMKERDPPILATRAPARPNVVACVIHY